MKQFISDFLAGNSLTFFLKFYTEKFFPVYHPLGQINFVYIGAEYE